MSLLDQLFVQNCYADLHIPSPNLPARSAPSCVLRQKHACVNEAVCCSTSSPSPSFTILCAAFSCRRLVTVAEAVTAITASASASFPHLSQQHPLHPGEHSFFTSAHPLLPLFPLDFLTHILGLFTLSHLPLPFCSTQQSPSPPSTLP